MNSLLVHLHVPGAALRCSCLQHREPSNPQTWEVLRDLDSLEVEFLAVPLSASGLCQNPFFPDGMISVRSGRAEQGGLEPVYEFLGTGGEVCWNVAWCYRQTKQAEIEA